MSRSRCTNRRRTGRRIRCRSYGTIAGPHGVLSTRAPSFTSPSPPTSSARAARRDCSDRRLGLSAKHGARSSVLDLRRVIPVVAFLAGLSELRVDGRGLIRGELVRVADRLQAVLPLLLLLEDRGLARRASACWSAAIAFAGALTSISGALGCGLVDGKGDGCLSCATGPAPRMAKLSRRKSATNPAL
jgi:hypothetical protein